MSSLNLPGLSFRPWHLVVSVQGGRRGQLPPGYSLPSGSGSCGERWNVQPEMPPWPPMGAATCNHGCRWPGHDNILNHYRKIHKSRSVSQPRVFRQCVLSVRALLASANTLCTKLLSKPNTTLLVAHLRVTSVQQSQYPMQKWGKGWEKLWGKKLSQQVLFSVDSVLQVSKNHKWSLQRNRSLHFGTGCVHSFKEWNILVWLTVKNSFLWKCPFSEPTRK